MLEERKESGEGSRKRSVDGTEASWPDGAQGEDIEKRRNVSEDNHTSDHGSRPRKASVHDDPFGDETNAAVKYRTMHWWQGAMIMIAETISLGILSLPSVLANIGLVPGIILLLSLGTIATYTGYTIFQFKMAYPHVHNLADVGEVMLGRIGREVFGAAQTIFLVFIMGSHILTFTIAMNAITGHATCTIVWGVVGVVILFLFTLPRTLRKVSYLSVASFISILSAILITMIGVGITQPDPVVQATIHTTTFASAFASTSNIIFAYAGHVAFFSFISELKNPKDFPKALLLLQACDIVLYLVVAVVIYRYCGADVSSPALGSASPVVAKVAYGVALPTILIAGVIYANVAAKYIYVRMFRGTRHMQEKTWLSFGSWVAIIFTLWVIAWIIAESIPVFNDLNSLITALFASWFTYGLSGIFWLYINHGQWFKNSRKICLTVINFLILVMGAAICGIGLYASGKAIHDDGGSGSSWSCADNSSS